MSKAIPAVKLNIIDRLIGYLAPAAGLRRVSARSVLAQYEAATPSRKRKFSKAGKSSNDLVQHGAVAMKNQARALERDHDIARGVIRVMVNNIIGPNGIGVEPQPRRKDGTIHEEYAKSLRYWYRKWCLAPEVSHRFHWSKCCRMMCQAWVRDGEVFAQKVMGPVNFLTHGTRIPFSLEMFESDLVPMDYDDESKNIRQGIQRNTWGQPTYAYVYKGMPGESNYSVRSSDLKAIEWDRIIHLASINRIGQLRGVTEFASIITRLEDIKDYEESERVAAKIAAALTAYVKKGSPELYEQAPGTTVGPDGNAEPREISFEAGMIIDSLGIGEEIGLIDSNRPNPNLITFRQGQLRAVAAGFGASYSSISRDYNGTYSAQRQELVEQWINYAILTDDFIGEVQQPVWSTFVDIAHRSGVVPMPADVDPDTADDALYVGQSMPWIDPLKEAMAWHALVRDGFASEVEVMRKRGVNPRDVLEQIDAHRKAAKEKGLIFSSDMANDLVKKIIEDTPAKIDD